MTSPSELMGSVRAVLAATIPGAPRPPRSSLDTVLGTQGKALNALSSSELAEFVMALITARIEAGLVTDAVRLANRTALKMLQGLSTRWSTNCQSASYSVIAEAQLLAGQLPQAVRYSKVALEYAEECGNSRLRLRSLGLRAAALALHGEIDSAQKAINQGWQLDVCNPTEVAGDCWALGLATITIATVRADARSIEQACRALNASKRDDNPRQAVEWLGLCLTQLVAQEFRSAVASAESGTRRSEASHYAPFLVDLGVAVGAMAALQLGKPGETLSLLATRSQLPDHPVCFDALRATAHLQLDNPRRALTLTDACVHDIPDHSPLTFCQVLLRRAAAFEMLGNRPAADAAFSKAAHIAHELGAATATLAAGIPLDQLRNLYARLVETEPEFTAVLTAAMSCGPAFIEPTPLGFAPPRLTKRETTLAYWLATELPFTEIAAKMHVSINTVKTQARSLYGKLQVTSRTEAVARLDRTGLNRHSDN
jgi:ATP/maltotriose-dependent transcriptional regulator MalT